jgi:predicted CXXCH cytochrome family protein
MRSIMSAGFLVAGILGVMLYGGDAKAQHSSPSPHTARTPPTKSTTSEYVDSGVCAGCHQQIAQSYGATGMGRSFSRLTPAKPKAEFNGAKVANQPSGLNYTMLQHDGKFFEQRSQIGYGGAETNKAEKQADYVIGSGNHAQTFLHRDGQGRLIELPVSWYAEDGGYWAMSPGFDRHDQEDFRRAISAECMFCHNGYPDSATRFNPAGLDPPSFPKNLSEGIDCQRCHGPGRAHVDAALSGADADHLRTAIVNPARLDRDRQLEVCMQCHLETSSGHMPNEIRSFDRGVFSYRPGQPLGDYKLYFDPLSNKTDDRFEIAHAAYRLRKSACFQKSQMTCLTCHDPHVSYRGPGSTPRYVAVCEKCHQEVKHTVTLPQTSTCLDCHMPKRRTDDAVHVVMTDHYIQRNKPDRDLLATQPEVLNKAGSTPGITLYYPPQLPASGRSELYLALAEVKDGSTGQNGIARLQKAILQYSPSEPEFYYELAFAYSKAGHNTEAVQQYQEALRRRPVYPAAAKGLAVSLLAQNHLALAENVLSRAAASSPMDDQLLADLGNVYLREGRIDIARRTLLRVLDINPDSPTAENLLGIIDLRLKNPAEAEGRLRAALRDDPSLPNAHYNIAKLFSGNGDYAQAAYHYQLAIANDPQNAESHHGYGLVLEMMHSYDQALSELDEGIRLNPQSAVMHSDLGDLLAARGQLQQAEEQYQSALQFNPGSADLHFSLGSVFAAEEKPQEAVSQLKKSIELDPRQYAAHLQLSIVLFKLGNRNDARTHCRLAMQSSDPDLRAAALQLLRQLGD